VIESDLGLSGRSASWRKGYLELLRLMDRNEVGIVLVQEQGRLGRKRSDSAAFLELAEETGTLIYTNGAVNDPASGDLAATLGLEMAGTFGNYDNRVRTRRMRDAKIAKASADRLSARRPSGMCVPRVARGLKIQTVPYRTRSCVSSISIRGSARSGRSSATFASTAWSFLGAPAGRFDRDRSTRRCFIACYATLATTATMCSCAASRRAARTGPGSP